MHWTPVFHIRSDRTFWRTSELLENAINSSAEKAKVIDISQVIGKFC